MKKFAKATLDEKFKVFMAHIIGLILKITIYQGKKAQKFFLFIEKITILVKYLNFINVFSKKLIKLLPERNRTNHPTIRLKKGNQPPFNLIYSLGLIEFKTFKTYIKTYLTIGFITPSKLSDYAIILFIKNVDGNLSLFVDYGKLKDLIIKN